MTDNRRYKILELATQGWSLIDNEYQNLTRAECDAKLRHLTENGVAPDRIKVAAQDDPRYASAEVDAGWIPPNV